MEAREKKCVKMAKIWVFFLFKGGRHHSLCFRCFCAPWKEYFLKFSHFIQLLSLKIYS